MTSQTEPIIYQQEIMIQINFLDGNFEVNQELIPVVQHAVLALGLSSIDDLKIVTQEDFFEIFTPLLNAHYGLG